MLRQKKVPYLLDTRPRAELLPDPRHAKHYRLRDRKVGRVEVASVVNSRRNLRGDARRRPLVDPCHLREMLLTVLVDREGRIAISHAGVVDPLVFEAEINVLLAE